MYSDLQACQPGPEGSVIDCRPPLGLSACMKLSLVKRVYVMKSLPKNVQCTLMEEYADVFEGLGCLLGVHTIDVDENVTPVARTCRKVLFALRVKLKEELAHVEKLKVIQRVSEQTDWVSSLVNVLKRDGTLRVCLDLEDLNKAI